MLYQQLGIWREKRMERLYYICDQADILSETDEEEVLELLEEVYDASGMPVTIQSNASPMLPLINF